MSYPWMQWALTALIVVMWARSWWRDRTYRLWFALLAPAAAIGGGVLGLVLTFSEAREAARSCVGSDCHGVAAFTGRVDGADGLGPWITANSALAFPVAAGLTVLTMVVESVLLVRRHTRAGVPAERE
ncbi:hypothetical protein [Actinoplanes utahensis]|uniref:Uncharacterized protein n=1 Tax=Actinoplanes utahensis TaxID=1869 RepID=A0A0A6UA58_ACTUT|nr:hypothetical protein [Actinoplanes utahensis]KHD72311.1 hypothetical protein MB27_38075 [Actinoplanes utahensis]GIF29643.1 hypothetical protein Aut01nite_26290 [Actinoplanes utahensis]